MKPITKRDLDGVVSRLNRTTKMPLEPYTKDADGRFKANIGNYHLDGAYGGWKLSRMFNESGGISDVLSCGYTSKRDLYNQIHAFLRGMEVNDATNPR